MTHQEKLTAVREAVIRAVPSIMDLKFGCKVKLLFGDYHGDDGLVEYQCGKCSKHKTGRKCNIDCPIEDAVSVLVYPEDEPREFVLLSNGKDYKILGRDIHLADVLLAIEGNIKSKWLKSPSPQETFGNYQPYLELNAHELLKRWDLTQDNLNDQSEETCNFLYNLLVSKDGKDM